MSRMLGHYTVKPAGDTRTAAIASLFSLVFMEVRTLDIGVASAVIRK